MVLIIYNGNKTVTNFRHYEHSEVICLFLTSIQKIASSL